MDCVDRQNGWIDRLDIEWMGIQIDRMDGQIELIDGMAGWVDV